VKNLDPEVRLAGDGVGYVKVPGYQGWEPSSLRTYAERFHQLLVGVHEAAVCGWIVDLRQDVGGNMWPMLAGLKPFLGDAALGTFESPSGSSPPWRAGSGEAVTIAFRGRPRTRSFGLPTAGLSTSNGTFPLPDGAAIFLTTAVEADRTGRRFGDKIEPDQRVDNEPVQAGDTAIEAATQWLRASSMCRAGAK
jgi:C-terminal processing protease CtpA/Prc